MSSLLVTNAIPGNLGCEYIRQVFASARADLQILDDRIAQVSRHLLELQTMQASIQKIASQHFMQIRGLPSELLIEIFMLTISDYLSSFHPEAAPYAPWPSLQVAESRFKSYPVIMVHHSEPAGRQCGAWRNAFRMTRAITQLLSYSASRDLATGVAARKRTHRVPQC